MISRERNQIPADVLNSVSSFIDNYPDHIILRRSGIIMVNKPAGIAMTAGSAFFSTGIVEIAEDFEGKLLRPVNRLDRDTSGIAALAESRASARNLSKQFEKRQVNKSYLALLSGEFPEHPVEVNFPLREITASDGRMYVEVSFEEKAKSAKTGFELLAVVEDQSGRRSSLVGIRLYTGRTHQIRVHSQVLGHPVVGDSVYGNDISDSRQMLHSHTTELVLPGELQPVIVEASMPADFLSYISRRKIVYGHENIDRLAA